jgi:glutamate synthase (NADPH) small chain
MAKPTGFLEYNRELPAERDPKERINDYQEIYKEDNPKLIYEQASRCMDCGVPFCQSGCPLGNNIPEFNDAVYQKNWELAYELLSGTNNFPEFTGRICPAPCESACVLGINKPAITIEYIEKQVAEEAFNRQFVTPNQPKTLTGKKVAIVGSGPAGLAAADQLHKAGHTVTVFERNDRIGGLLRYGIPDFKLEKTIIDRRLDVMLQSGITFKTSVNVGVDITTEELLNSFDAVVLCGGSTIPRDIPVKGRELEGIYYAMDFLEQQNRRVAGDTVPEKEAITATGKKVVVLGGGDTGSDCIGTSNRQMAESILQIELLNQPPKNRAKNNPWPEYAFTLKTTSSHEEGCDRVWNVLTKEFVGENGNLTGLKVVNVEWKAGKLIEDPKSERVIPADIVLLAVGYLHPQHEGLLQQLNVALTDRGNVADKAYNTNIAKVFTAGDMRRGQSLVVWAISEGREAARQVDLYLQGSSQLPSKDQSYYKSFSA